MHNEIGLKYGVAGYYKLEAFKQDAEGNEIPGSRRIAADWFPNLITNTGLNMIGKGSSGNSGNYRYMRGCQVGSGSTAPAITDTALVSRIGSSVNRISAQDGRDLSAPTARFAWHRMVYRFNPGGATGNVSEIGIVGGDNDGTGTGGAMAATAELFSRALVLDGGGSPTTVTILADETLDVTYELRLYMPNGDVTGTITLNGSNYDWVLRNSDTDQGPAVNQGGWGSTSPNNPANVDLSFRARQSVGYGENCAYVGSSSAIGAEIDFPSGTSCGIGSDASTGQASMSTSVYVTNDYYVDINFRWELGPAIGSNINSASGIGALRCTADCCSFQIGFTPRIVKTPDMIFLFSFRISWARYP